MKKNISKNRVYINKFGIIEAVAVGDQTPESVQSMFNQADALSPSIRKTGKPVYILDNLLDVGKASQDVLKIVVANIKANKYDKFAFVGSGAFFRLSAFLVLTAIGQNNAKYFDNYDEAVAWLTAENDS